MDNENRLKELEQMVMDLLQAVANLEERVFISETNNSFSDTDYVRMKLKLSEATEEKEMWKNQYYKLKDEMMNTIKKSEMFFSSNES